MSRQFSGWFRVCSDHHDATRRRVIFYACPRPPVERSRIHRHEGQPRMPDQLAGMTALVTGPPRGIGAAIATALAAEGANVLVTGRDEARGRGVVERIRAAGN